MENNKKEAYIASSIFIIVGILFLVTGFDSGGWQNNKIVIVLGGIMSLVGIGGVSFPKIGEIILHYVKGLADKNNKSYSQRQTVSRNSPQIQGVKGNVNVTFHNGSSNEKRKKIRDFHLLKHIYNNRKKTFFTSKELATITNKDLEETNESLRYFKEKGWVELGSSNEAASYAIIMKADGIDLVEENE